jgi:hypothetical protein
MANEKVANFKDYRMDARMKGLKNGRIKYKNQSNLDDLISIRLRRSMTNGTSTHGRVDTLPHR